MTFGYQLEQQRKEMEHSLLTLCKQARALIAVDQPV